MPTPQGIKTVTIHGRFVEPDLFGTPLVGSLTFTPNVPMVTFPVENTLMSGTETATLDANGEFFIDLPVTDTAGQNPSNWTYTVTEKFVGVRGRSAYQIALPYTVSIVELSDISPTEVAPTYLPVTGPQGPPGLVQSVNGISMVNIVLDADDVQALGLTGDQTATGTKTLERIRLTDTSDLTLSSTTHAFQIGPTSGVNLRIDGNEIATLNNGAASTLEINSDGGSIGMFSSRTAGSTVDTLTVNGRISANGIDSSVAPTAIQHVTRKDYVDGLDAQNVKLTGTQSVAGSKTWTSAAYFTGSQVGINITSGLLGRTHIKSTVDEISLYLEQTATGTTNPQLNLAGAETAGSLLAGKVTGDTVNRFALKASGNLEFGPGNAARDAALYRSAAAVVSSTGQFASDAASPTAASHLTRKDYVDNSTVSLTTTQGITGLKNFSNSTDTNSVLTARVTGEANPRFILRASGELRWGDGVASTDTNLYREEANSLATLGLFRAYRSTTSGNAFSARVVGDTASRWYVNADGETNWGPGGSTSADTTMARTQTGRLVLTGTNASFGIGTAVVRPILPGASVTVANTTTETVVGTFVIPANDAVVGAIYRLKVAANVSFLASATLTWRVRLGGVGGTSLAQMGATTLSGTAQTNKESMVEADVVCISTGAAGTWFASFTERRNTTQAASVGEVQMNFSDGPITRDTTAQNTMVVTAQWGAASASNTLTAYTITAERFA